MKTREYKAAGGVVVYADRVLVLRRPSRDEIRLPKGHIEEGETARTAARREVIEESGYTDLSVIADLGCQTVEFDYEEAHIIREENYFLMSLRTLNQVKRSRKELQFEPIWQSWQETINNLTFEAEREWVRRARQAFSL
jgi:8-oxo-dGTP pyrophosphatase MutT (NUDIX family)